MSQRPPLDRTASDRRGTDHPADGCRYELRYVTSEDRSKHEPWLFEWVLDTHEIDDIVSVSLAREDGHPRSIVLEISTRSASGLAALDERYQSRLAELADRVDDFTIRRFSSVSMAEGGRDEQTTSQG